MDVEDQAAQVERARIERAEEHEVDERLACRKIWTRARHGDGKVDVDERGQRATDLIRSPTALAKRLLDLRTRHTATERIADEVDEFVSCCHMSGG